jgi:hypothetical protein
MSKEIEFSFSQYLNYIESKRLDTPENIAALREHRATVPTMKRAVTDYQQLKRAVERFGVTL